MRVQREIAHRDGVYVDVRQPEKAVVLLEQSRLWVIGQDHFLCHVFPTGHFFCADPQLIGVASSQHAQGVLEGAFGHVIGVGVIVHHHLEFIWPHDGVIAKLSLWGPLAAASQKTADFHQQFAPLAPQKSVVSRDLHVVPDGIGYPGGRL
ncbi:hypothetical protein SDC9_208560 [bioreactor metagenome]|uniref:Uncharacterized protein n=1 Tax=bioreactor metagenome TaxID=1076179 RepID=A0A645JAZ5_9ZZZZ